MRSKKILVIGYFGYSTNQIDGQTIRTRSIYSLLSKYSSHEVLVFDTESVKSSKKHLLILVKLLYQSDVVFNIAAHRNLRYFFPVIFVACKIINVPLNYVAVGGWLCEHLESLPIHRYMLTKIKNIFVQTENLHNQLRLSGFENVHILNNFRFIDLPKIPLKDPEKPIQKLVFMARVHPLKGVDTIFKLYEQLKVEGINDVSIDIYGPILEEYKKEFFNKINSSTVSYNGVIEPENVYEVLKEYNLMLFPTRYFTEGFPGSILDAYISGLPVIATNWANAQEFIANGKTGYVSDFDNERQFIDLAISLIRSPIKINSLSKNIELERHKYSPEKAWIALAKALL